MLKVSHLKPIEVLDRSIAVSDLKVLALDCVAQVERAKLRGEAWRDAFFKFDGPHRYPVCFVGRLADALDLSASWTLDVLFFAQASDEKESFVQLNDDEQFDRMREAINTFANYQLENK